MEDSKLERNKEVDNSNTEFLSLEGYTDLSYKLFKSNPE